MNFLTFLVVLTYFSPKKYSLLTAIQLLDQAIPYTMGIPWYHLEASNQAAGNDHTITISNLWGLCALNIVTVWIDYLYRSTKMEKIN